MNNVTIVGRLTRDPEIRWTTESKAIATFKVAIDRGKDKNGNDRGADFPRVTVFGRQAENCEKYLRKGRLVSVVGKIHTDSYEKDGQKIYTTDIVADRVEFLEWGESAPRQQMPQQGYTQPQYQNNQYTPAQQTFAQQPIKIQTNVPAGWEIVDDDDIPF